MQPWPVLVPAKHSNDAKANDAPESTFAILREQPVVRRTGILPYPAACAAIDNFLSGIVRLASTRLLTCNHRIHARSARTSHL